MFTSVVCGIPVYRCGFWGYLFTSVVFRVPAYLCGVSGTRIPMWCFGYPFTSVVFRVPAYLCRVSDSVTMAISKGFSSFSNGHRYSGGGDHELTFSNVLKCWGWQLGKRNNNHTSCVYPFILSRIITSSTGNVSPNSFLFRCMRRDPRRTLL